MSKIRFVLVGSLMVTACQSKLADQTEDAAERVTTASKHLRHERQQLVFEVAQRADDRAAGRDITHHVGEIAAQVKDVSREAGALAEAEQDFEHLRALRIVSLRAERSVAASQPLLIESIANEKRLSPQRRVRLDENLVIFRHRLAHTQQAIEALQYVKAAEWEDRDDEVGRAMAGMFIARDASWSSIDDDYRENAFPES
ncbi:MAG: hypothetical protein M4D80_20680 [Myxococcota bacterium]|nr:hypothetical protein [Deltaproteobacteria bacterium]MDQ3337584.1 hypothetical protein [Myxococcota bacterium]